MNCTQSVYVQFEKRERVQGNFKFNELTIGHLSQTQKYTVLNNSLQREFILPNAISQ